MAVMLAHLATALYVVVRVYDTQGLPPAELAAARSATERILKDADIAVRWADCPCNRPAGPVELMIRVAASTPESEPASLGFSYVDVNQRIGTLATVFADRVHTLADAVRADQGELLGRAMAHEIGHLLLGTHDHERAGLMRGQWTSIELSRNSPFDWRLSSADGAHLRQALSRRIRGVREARALVAALSPRPQAFSPQP
jgi:hypothetical protein